MFEDSYKIEVWSWDDGKGPSAAKDSDACVVNELPDPESGGSLASP